MLAGIVFTYASGHAQTVTLSSGNITLSDAFKEIRKQTGYNYLWSARNVASDQVVSVSLREAPVEEAIEHLLRSLPLTYQLEKQTILIKERPGETAGAPPATPAANLVLAYETVTGRVVDSLGQPLAGASVRVLNDEGKRTTLQTKTDSDGYFLLRNVPEDAMLEVTYVGYLKRTVHATSNTGLIVLQALKSELEEVEVMVNTGYQALPKERATGSFSYVSKAQLNRNTSRDLLDRLEGVTPGLVIDRRNVRSEIGLDAPKVRIRGESSIYSSMEPLIVLDNFPYEGDLSSINPDNIESVTVLKDAAAASIWGARAGNGVIVITTKQGKYDERMRISVDNNFTLKTKPDFYANKGYLGAEEYIEGERFFFQNGVYTSIEQSATKQALTPAVELFIAERDGLLSTNELEIKLRELADIDFRKEALDNLYRNGFEQRHTISINGGTHNFKYVVDANVQRYNELIRRNGQRNFTLANKSFYKPLDWIEFQSNISYVQQQKENNGLGVFSNIVRKSYPYARLRNADGSAAPIFNDYRQAYVENPPDQVSTDWIYRPLEDMYEEDKSSGSRELIFFGGANLRLFKGFTFDLKYQFRDKSNEQDVIRGEDSYVMRNYKNRYTQPDGTSAFPEGGIAMMEQEGITEHNGRAQLNYQGAWRGKHEVYALGGAEVRQIKSNRGRATYYGYDPEYLTFDTRLDLYTYYNTLPYGTATISTPSHFLQETTNRYISYFGNASYSFMGKYTATASLRADASNLFGVNINQKWVPLWSAGLAWDLSSERFYELEWLPKLRIRTTYGRSGNINNSVTAFLIAIYGTNEYGEQDATIRSAGNPNLRWEKVNTTNVGIDFAVRNSRISGSVDFFKKIGRDLFGNISTDPTDGTSSLSNRMINYASTKTTGFDLALQTRNLLNPISWTSDFYISYTNDKVIDYDRSQATTVWNYVSLRIPPTIGRSMNSLYTMPKIKLDPENGDPLVLFNGEYGKNYGAYSQSLSVDEMVYFGNRDPKITGGLRNTVSFKKWSISANIVFKAAYYFNPSTIEYDQFARNGTGHSDFTRRWKKPGDELITDVPSQPAVVNSSRDLVYTLSANRVERGDHIRLRDVNVAYEWSSPIHGLQPIRFYFQATNLGLLYSANKRGLDPDLRSSAQQMDYLPPVTYSIGFNFKF